MWFVCTGLSIMFKFIWFKVMGPPGNTDLLNKVIKKPGIALCMNGVIGSWILLRYLFNKHPWQKRDFETHLIQFGAILFSIFWFILNRHYLVTMKYSEKKIHWSRPTSSVLYFISYYWSSVYGIQDYSFNPKLKL